MNLLNTSDALDCGRLPCPEHSGLCAYHGTEPDRCPWCHATWTKILGAGFHSCETTAVWTNGKRPDNAQYVAGRIAQAAAMRAKAAEEASQRPFRGWQSGHCAHQCAGTPEGSTGRAKAQGASEGVSHE